MYLVSDIWRQILTILTSLNLRFIIIIVAAAVNTFSAHLSKYQLNLKAKRPLIERTDKNVLGEVNVSAK
jgi:hypothetical protein